MGSRIAYLVPFLGLLVLQLLVLMGPAAASTPFQGLYEIEIPVRSQSAEDRARALQQGMADVIVRLSGPDGLKLLARSEALKAAGQYVEQYRYRLEPGAEAGLTLWARFNRSALLALLREQQITVWAGSRPETLIWLAIEGKQGRYILGSKQTNAWSGYLKSHAQRRGLPVLLPLMDSEDKRKVRIGDIWGGFSKSLQAASRRYKPDDIMMGKVYHTRSGWNASWTLVTAAGEKKWTVNGQSASKVIAAGVDGLADFMAARYSTRVSGQIARYRLVVNNIDTLSDYNQVSQYLKRIGLISRLRLDSVSPGSVVFAMDLRGGASALRQVLGLEQKLLPDDVQAFKPAQPGDDQRLPRLQVQEPPEIMVYRLR